MSFVRRCCFSQRNKLTVFQPEADESDTGCNPKASRPRGVELQPAIEHARRKHKPGYDCGWTQPASDEYPAKACHTRDIALPSSVRHDERE
jgi:hypothetical protein